MLKSARGLIICVSAVVLAVGLGSAGFRNWQISVSNERNCAAVTEWVESRGAFVRAGTGQKQVVVLGDSYTAGEKLPDRADGWVFDFAHLEGWTVFADGIGNTGFTNGGFCGNQDFASRVPAILGLDADLVIVQGGLNDGEADKAEVVADADLLLDRLQTVPEVVVVGPVRAPAREGMEAIDAALSGAAARHSRQYISTLTWDLPMLPDQLHLTEAGHAEYAERIAAILASYGRAPD